MASGAPVTSAAQPATGASTASPAAGGTAQQPAGARAADEPRFTVAVSCKVDGEAAQVSFTTFRRTLIQQIMDSSLAFFKISPSQSQTAQLVLGGKQVISFTAQSTVEDLKLTTPDRQSLELVLLDEEPEVTFPVRDQYGNEEVLRARLYHPFVDAVRKLLDPDSPALQAQPPPAPVPAATTASTGGTSSQPNQQQPHGLDVDLYRSSDVSLISLQNSPAACGLQGGEPLLLYRYGRCSREYWRGLGQPERGLKPTFAGLYISDYKNQGHPDRMRPSGPQRRETDTPLAQQQQQPSGGTQHGVHSAAPPTGRRRPCRLQFQGRAVFRHDLAMPLEYLLSTYCKWRGIEKDKASFLWLQFYMRLGIKDTGLGRGMDDGDTIYIFDKQDPQGKLWDGVLDGNVEAVRKALDEGSSLEGPEGSFEAITSRWPLHAAAANNHLAVAEALVERGADVDKLDAVSEPALWHAVEQGHGEMVALLLKLGATASDLPCPPGKTKADYAALCHAAEKGSLAMVQLLLDKGANPYTYDDTGYCAYDYLVDQAKPLELLRALLNADSAFSATQKSYQQAYQRLCAAVKRAQRYPALGCNCRTCNSVVEVRAAEAEATQTLKAQIGCVALVRAVQAGGPHCLEAMQLLHAHGALLDGQDQDGRTALHQAIRYNRLAEAKFLVTAGAHLDVADFEGLLPLHQAACTGNVEFARLLVEAGAPINLHTVKYITQESLEAQTKKQEAGSGGRKAAKKRNALDVTGLTTIGGNSALALAVRHGHAAVVEYLLSQQASFDLKNPADSSAFHAALDRGAASVASKLLQHLNKPKPGKAGAGVSTALVTAGGNLTVAKVKAKDTAASKDKAARKASLIADASCKVGAASGGAAGNAGGSGAAGQSTSDSDGGGGDAGKGGGDISSPEPALAVDAGAGLREIVQAERERLRQEKGLGRATATDASAGAAGGPASTLRQAPSLMQQLEALKAAEKAAAAKAAADQQQQAAAAAKSRADAESAAAERARAAARAKGEEAARRRAEEEDRRQEEEAALAKRKADDMAAAAKAKADAAAEQVSKAAVAAVPVQSASKASAGRAAAGALPNGGSTGAQQQQQQQQQQDASAAVADAADADGVAGAKPAGVQILFRSTSTAIPTATKQQVIQAAPAPSASTATQKPGRASSTASSEGKSSVASAAILASPTTNPAANPAPTATPSAKKGKGKGKAAAVAAPAAEAEHAGPSPSSVPSTPSKHSSNEPHGSNHKQTTAPGTASKRGAAGKVAAAPTAAALAASAALAHSTASLATRSSGSSQQHANGPIHSAGYDSSYNGGFDDHGSLYQGGSHTVTPGMSPRHAGSLQLNSSAANTPVRSSKPSSRRNSFSSGNLTTLQHGWPGHPQQQAQHHPPPGMQQQQLQQHQQPADLQVLFAGISGHPSLRLPTGGMVPGGPGQGQGLGELGGLGLHMASHHQLTPLRHSPPGPRVPASGTPTAAQDDTGLWDDAGHLESFVMSVVTDEAGASSNGTNSSQQHSMGARGLGAQHHHSSGKLDGGAPPHSPFGSSMPQGTGWDMGGHHQTSVGSNGTPRAPPPGITQRAATAPQGLDRAASADVLSGLGTHSHMMGDARGAGVPRPGGLGVMGSAADEPYAGWMRGAPPGMMQPAGAGGLENITAAASWSQQQQQQGGLQQPGAGGAAAGPPPGWGSWMQQQQQGGSSIGSTGDVAGSSNTQPKASGSVDSAQQFMSGATAAGLGLTAGAAPFVPGEPSHWQSRGGDGPAPATAQPRELDPLPHLPASLFEDDADVVTPVVLEPPAPAVEQQQQGRGNGGQQQGQGVGQQQAPPTGGGNASHQGAHGGGNNQQGPGMGAQGGRGAQANRPASRGRPAAALHTRTASAGNSQDGTGGPAAGRYPPGGAGVRMGMGAYPGMAPPGTQQPPLPGLYGGPQQQEANWYNQQAGWQGPGQGQGYPPGMGGVPPSAHVQAPHAANAHAHSAAAMYQVLNNAGMGGGPGWGDGGVGGPQMNGYWPPMGRGPQGMGDIMGVARGRGIAPSQGQPPRYRQL